MLGGIILAAGDSTRMGRPKALLADAEERPFVARIARTFAAGGIDEVVIVTGAQHGPIVNAMTADDPVVPPRIVRNPNPSRGQLSSLLVGLDALMRPELEAVLVTLVDVPMTSPQTLRTVVDAWRRSRAPIVRPAIGDRHGHPVLFDRRLFEELRAAPLEAGAKTVLHAHAGEVLNVDVDDEGCLIDVDTPADYAALRARS